MRIREKETRMSEISENRKLDMKERECGEKNRHSSPGCFGPECDSVWWPDLKRGMRGGGRGGG